MKSKKNKNLRVKYFRTLIYIISILFLYFIMLIFIAIDSEHLKQNFSILFTVQQWCLLIENSLNNLWIFIAFSGILSTLEYLRPADDFETSEYAGNDIIYSLFENLGLSGLALTILVSPSMDQLVQTVQALGIPLINLRSMLEQYNIPSYLIAIILLFLFDGFDTIRHRIEHRLTWLWAFHSIHHSQTRMDFMTFDRNHIISLIYNACFYAIIGRFLGITPGYLFSVLILFNFIEYFTHATISISYGKFFDRLLVCPLYHRTHHSYSSKPKPYANVNFANIFPFWDIIFNSANFNYKTMRTGIKEQCAHNIGSHYLSHQMNGFTLFWNAVKISAKNLFSLRKAK